jgi:hypothetical protein
LSGSKSDNIKYPLCDLTVDTVESVYNWFVLPTSVENLIFVRAQENPGVYRNPRVPEERQDVVSSTVDGGTDGTPKSDDDDDKGTKELTQDLGVEEDLDVGED